MTDTQMKYIDLSGYMFSGKSAFSDLLREFDGFDVPSYHTEFDLIRISGGLLDLRTTVVDNWSPMRADASLRRFIKLIQILSCTPRGYKKLIETGFGYEKNYPNILNAMAQFVNNITEDSWVMDWPYEMVELSSIKIFKTKIYSKLTKVL